MLDIFLHLGICHQSKLDASCIREREREETGDEPRSKRENAAHGIGFLDSMYVGFASFQM